jgi:hypothetical protein
MFLGRQNQTDRPEIFGLAEARRAKADRFSFRLKAEGT